MQTLNLFFNNKLFVFIFMLFLGFVFSFYLELKKKTIKKKYSTKKSIIDSLEDTEKESLEYFSKIQQLDIYKYSFYFILTALFLLYFDIKAFSFFAVALGAIIIALKDPILSFISHFFLLSRYRIGDDIRVIDALGEIISIRPLYTGIAGKEENGEYNGKLFYIPNYYFFQNIVEFQELKSDDYRLVKMEFLWRKKDYKKSFEYWVVEFKSKLDNLLPQRTLKEVGNYKSFAGVRYKINYEHNDRGYVVIKLSFISMPTYNIIEKKEDIINFLESTKIL